MKRAAGGLLLTIALAGCSAVEEARPPARLDDVDPGASAEELYFEALELRTDGLMPEKRFEALQSALDDAGDDSAAVRRAIGPILQRTRDELGRGADADAFAGHEGREYARRLNRAGLEAAASYSEHLVLAAGLIGIPTSKTDAVLMVAVPVGGVIVLKLGKLGLKQAAFLLRRMRSADEVVDQATRLGFKAAYAADAEELRHLAGEAAVQHVGGAGGVGRTKRNPWNPEARKDNCAACVGAVLRNGIEGSFRYSASDIERVFGYAGKERRFTPQRALAYLQEVTGLTASAKPVSMLGEGSPVGHYAVMTGWDGVDYQHVVYGRVTPTGRVIVFDPQINARLSYAEMLERYKGRAAPYLLEAK